MYLSDREKRQRRRERALEPTQQELDVLDDMKVLGVEVKSSTILGAGLGVFTTHPLPIHTVLGQYKGEVLNQEEIEKSSSKDMSYVMYIGANKYVDATDPTKSNWLRFINSPWKSGQRATARLETNGVIKTIRNIPAGKEILYSYGPYYKYQD